MNYDDDKKLENVTPYRATGNLNTAISNPSIDINDTMDVNIKKTYVTTDNKPKKKKFDLNLTKEFKIALLIIVILFVFVFILDLLPKLF